MALEKNRSRINVVGGGLLKLEQIASGGALQTMRDTGHLVKVNLNDKHAMVKSVDIQGSLVHVQSGGRDVEIDVELKQSSSDEIGLLIAAPNKFYHIYYQVYLPDSGRYQELYAPCCIINPNLSLAFDAGKERIIPMKIHCLAPKGDVAVTPSDFNITAPAPYILIESAAAKGQITTAPGTIWTAAV